MVKKMKYAALAGAVALLIAGCGGGGGSSAGGGSGGEVTGSQTGVFTDSAIEGVEYSTTSGVKGKTDAQGRFRFNTGDQVTFSLGDLEMGVVAASALVTPIDLARGNQTRLNNMLVVLQSLDRDGNPANGITVPAAAADAMPALNLAATLTASELGKVKTAMTAGGISGEPKSEASAREHFLEQAPALLASNVWIVRDNGVPTIALRVREDGHYVIGEGGQDGEVDGFPGVEFGTVKATAVDANGFRLQATTTVDTSGDWGLSGLRSFERLKVAGDVLHVYSPEPKDVTAFQKMENDPKGLVGAWLMADEKGVVYADSQLMLFFKDGYFMMVDAIGDMVDPGDTSCGGPGVEVGKYSYDAATGKLTPGTVIVNQNGCAGLFEDGVNPTTHTVTLAADGKTASYTGSDSGGSWRHTMVRVSR